MYQVIYRHKCHFDLFIYLKKIKGTDAKGFDLLHGLAALNIYFGGSQDASQIAMGEYLKNLT